MKDEKKRSYIAIDLKSFYASVECVERNLDPLKAHLVVADESRTEKTICLAVTPALKAFGIPGRARLFEVNAALKNLKDPPEVIVAPPRMKLYMDYSRRIFDIYQRFVSNEDIHVYSIDEVFMDVTDYLNTYRMSEHELALTIIREVLSATGITATAGIGTNLYLAKVAMDIVAKHIEADEDGVRIAQLDEESYKRLLWTHTPITDFWRVGKGYAKKLADNGMYTMGDVARCSLGGRYDIFNPELLYKLFGVNARLLIDHAWGYEPCRISDIKAYKPENNSMSIGQVLPCPYDFEKGRLIVREMMDLLSLDLVEKNLVADQVVLTVCYDVDNLKNPEIMSKYKGELTSDYYGRVVPKHAHGTINLGKFSSSSRLLIEKVTELFDRIVEPSLLVRRVYVVANHVIAESEAVKEPEFEQLDLFTDPELRQKEALEEKKEKDLQRALLDIKKKFGKNAVLKGMNLQEGATTRARNAQVGGHKS